MIEGIRSFVSQHILRAAGPDPAPATGGPSGVQLAACALLLELAHADGEFSDQEREHIEGALHRHFGLDQRTVGELMALAESERSQSIDHFQFTRLIVQHYDLGQKMVLAELMWGVILADGRVGDHEAYLVRKLASLLQLEPGYLAEARRAASPPG
ncbi:MAG: TerB family tellurite resistance protein [Acidobacteria bacterium]|nr:TerB family tellurite resistance protein [Acidobacteriota bacterium]